MAAEQVLQGLKEDFLTCSICMVRFQNPLMLPCLHSFCSSCLEKWKTTAGKQPLSCPTCRRHVNLPNTGVKGLPRNFLLTSVMEKLDLVGKLTKEKSSNCDFCRNTTKNALFCTDCQLHVCLTCQGGHSRLPGASDHVMIEAKQVSDNNYLKDVTKKKPPCCLHHPQEKLRFYCEECSSLVCRDCAILTHQGHKCCEVEQVVTDTKNSLERCQKESQMLVQNTKQDCEKLKNLTKSIETHTTTLKREVNDQYEKYVDILNSQKNALCQEIEKMKDEKIQKINERLSSMMSWLEATDHTLRLTRQIVEENNQWEIVGNAVDLIQSFKTLTREQAANVKESDRMEGEASVITRTKFFPTTALISQTFRRSSVTQSDSNLLGNFSPEFAESSFMAASGQISMKKKLPPTYDTPSLPIYIQQEVVDTSFQEYSDVTYTVSPPPRKGRKWLQSDDAIECTPYAYHSEVVTVYLDQGVDIEMTAPWSADQ